MGLLNNGEFRKIFLECTEIRPSGLTTVAITQTFDIRDEFAITGVSAVTVYSAITSAELAQLTEVEYEDRRDNFYDFIGVNDSLRQALNTGGTGTDLINCPIP